MNGNSPRTTSEMSVAGLLRSVGPVALTFGSFNPANLLVRRETDLSRVFAWLLDPAADHGAGATHLALFLQTLGLQEPIGLRRSRVELEATRRARGSVIGRVDIQVAHPEMLLLVENKPTAPFGDRQVQRYLSSLPKRCALEVVVVLLGRGWDLASVARLHHDARVVVARLGVEVRDWVARCAEAASPGRVRDFMDAIREDLEVRHGGMEGAAVERTLDEMMAGPEAVAAAVAVIEARDAFQRRLSRDFEERVSIGAGS